MPGSTSSATSAYLARLSAALELLGPEESQDVVAEIRSHIAEAIRQEGAPESAVLDDLGEPEVLAEGILVERGVLDGPSPLPWWLVGAAALLDATLWVALTMLLVSFLAIVPVSILAYQGQPPAWLPLLAVGGAVLVALLTAWRSIWSWRRVGGATLGMRLLGLRRVRLGAGQRLVRTSEIPGLSRDWRVWPAVAVVLAAGLVATVAANVVAQAPHAVEVSVRDSTSRAGDVVGAVSELYQGALTGQSAQSQTATFAPAVRSAYGRLLERHRQGALASYSIGHVQLDEAYAGESLPSDGTMSFVVSALEYGTASTAEPQEFLYHVTTSWKPEGQGISEEEIVIDSVEHVAQ
jgi:hypothetical protein